MVYIQRIILTFAAFLIFSAPALAEKPADAEYIALVQQARRMPDGFDFDRLRWLYTKTSYYNAVGAAAYKTELFKHFDAYKANKDPAAKAAIGKMINDHYGHYKMHTYIGGFQMANNTDFINPEEHKRGLIGLYKSMISDGDGKSAATSFKVTEVGEEYFIVKYQTRGKGKVTGQSLRHENGHSYDVLEFTNQETNEKGEMWFNIDVPFMSYEIPGENPPSPAIPPR